VRARGTNSVLIATQVSASVVTFLNNETNDSNPGYSEIAWSDVKLHVHVSTRNATSYQLVDFSGYVPTNIQGSNPATAITQYTGNVLTSTASSTTLTTTSESGNLGLDSAYNISIQAANNLTLTAQTGTIEVYSDFEFNVEAKSGVEFHLSDPGVNNTFRMHGSEI